MSEQTPSTGADREVSPPAETWEELEEWLKAMPDIPRAKFLNLLVDAQNIKRFAAMRKAAIANARRTRSAADVAADLGKVSVHAVYKAVKEHNQATRQAQANTSTP